MCLIVLDIKLQTRLARFYYQNKIGIDVNYHSLAHSHAYTSKIVLLFRTIFNPLHNKDTGVLFCKCNYTGKLSIRDAKSVAFYKMDFLISNYFAFLSNKLLGLVSLILFYVYMYIHYICVSGYVLSLNPH